jgi:sugar phosphate isomerase/epimerase
MLTWGCSPSRPQAEMRIAYNTWSMASVPYGTFIPGLAEIGYTAIAISVVPGYTIGGAWVPNACALDSLSASDRRAIKIGLAERDLLLASVVGNQSLSHTDPEQHTLAMQHLYRAVDLAAELASDDVPTMNTGVGQGVVPDAQLLDRLRTLAEYGSGRGVTICLEPHVGTMIDSVDRAAWVIEAVDDPALRLDFDVSHFEVVGVPTAESVSRLVPLAAAVEIKDQRLRYLDEPSGAWHVQGNGSGRATAPGGRPVEFQFLLGGEGEFDLSAYLRLMCDTGWQKPIAFEASVQCQARPDYDPLAVAASVYRWMRAGWQRAGITP